MGTRKAWTQREDNILRLLKEQRGQIKWSAIAQIMERQFSICGKTGKQCRQRYHNHLKASISNAEWGEEEDRGLLRLHGEYGNKWSIIAQKIQGRSQNCVKNRFYSKLRKVVRKLNQFNTGISKSPTPIIPMTLLSKIISASEDRFGLASRISDEWINFSLNLITRLYYSGSSYGQEVSKEEQDREAEIDLIKDLLYFEQNFKKKRLNKNDLNEEDYRQRASKDYKRAQRRQMRAKSIYQGRQTSFVQEREEKILLKDLTSKLGVDNQGNDPSFPSESVICQHIQYIPAEDNEQNVLTFLKGKANTFDSFCELDKGSDLQAQIHISDESGQCMLQQAIDDYSL